MSQAEEAAGQRKGASRTQDVPAEVIAALQCGTAASKTLVEALAIDFAPLLATVAPEVPSDTHSLKATVGGISKRMVAIGDLLLAQEDEALLTRLKASPSDTVRGWVAHAEGRRPAHDLQQRLARVLDFADDPHFAVREWAWLAVRPWIVEAPETAIDALAPWTASPSARVRRFASEATRPRGVWAAHIDLFKSEPWRALAVLDPLCADPDSYVQLSVGNWLNDAAKSQRDWVLELCARWRTTHGNEATDHVCRRGTRSIKEN